MVSNFFPVPRRTEMTQDFVRLETRTPQPSTARSHTVYCFFFDGEPVDDVVVETQSPSAFLPGQDADP